jgi:hypothetical protein
MSRSGRAAPPSGEDARREAATKPLLDRLEKARARSLTPPEWCFKRAQKKHKQGHHIHDYDQLSTPN